MGWSNGPRTWKELHRVLVRRAAAQRPGGGRGRLAGVVAQAPAVPGRRRERSRRDDRDARPVRGAALPLRLLVPRRRVASREARRGSRTARSRCARDHRPRRDVRDRPVRGGRARGRPADDLRRRAHARRHAHPERHRRPGRRPPRRPRARSVRVRAPVPRDLARAAARREGTSRARHAPSSSELCGGRWVVLTGCRKGAVPRALVERGPSAARDELARLVEAFGRDNVAVELWDHGDPLDSHRNDALAEIAATRGRPARRDEQRPLRDAAALTACTPRSRRSARAGRSTRSTAGSRRPAPRTCARGPSSARASRATPASSSARRSSGVECAFDLRLIAPNLPPYPVPQGETEATFLRQLTYDGALKRYGPRENERVAGAWAQIDRELARHRADGLPRLLPDRLGHRRVLPAQRHPLPGTRLGRQLRRLLRARHHQRRRGVARPAVRALPVTGARRSAGHRHRHRGRTAARRRSSTSTNATDVTTPRRSRTSSPTVRASAVRDAAKALGYSQGQQDAWSKQMDGWTGRRPKTPTSREQRHRARATTSRTSRATSGSTRAGWCCAPVR